MLVFLSCGEDFFGKYSPAECQQVVFEPPSGLLSLYHPQSAPHLLAVNSPCMPAGSGAAAPTKLFVTNFGGNRITTYDIATITDGEDAVNVLGQADFDSANLATTQSGMNSPQSVAYDATNNRLFVDDTGNNRVLVFDVSTITNGENAVNVLGQADFTSSAAATTQSRLRFPSQLAYDSVNNLLYVGDGTNNRVMVFNVASITNGENAVNVLCQTNFTSATAATTQSGCNEVTGVALQ